jgi:hypothetical protein
MSYEKSSLWQRPLRGLESYVLEVGRKRSASRPACRGISVAKPIALRGAGVGNEIIPWAKALIAARELRMHPAPPLWLLNRYGLAREFGISRVRMTGMTAATAVLPRIVVSEEMFRSTSAWDYGAAIRILSSQGVFPRKPFCLVNEGMWGGYLAIRSTRNLLLHKVLASPGVLEHLEALGMPSPTTLTIAVHVRRGDFLGEAPRPGQFNRALPMDWYKSAMLGLAESLCAVPLRFIVVSDSSTKDLSSDIAGHEVLHISGSPLDDLAVLATSDVLVSSVSSFSMLAAFLSDAPYLWYRNQLTDVDGYLTIWGHEQAQQSDGSPTLSAVREPDEYHASRGIPYAIGDSLPEWLPERVKDTCAIRRLSRDLIYYGVVPTQPKLA